jgi:hypothetical protein
LEVVCFVLTVVPKGHADARFRGQWSPSIHTPQTSVAQVMREREAMLQERHSFAQRNKKAETSPDDIESLVEEIGGLMPVIETLPEQDIANDHACKIRDSDRSSAPMTVPVKSAKKKMRPGEREMADSYQIAGWALRQNLNKTLPSLLDLLFSLDGGRILSIAGQYDHAHEVLEANRVPFTSVTQTEFCDMDLSDVVLVYLNCGPCTDERIATVMHKFVARGGHLVSTDWAIKIVAAAFPGTIIPSHRQTDDDVVAISHYSDQDWVLGDIFKPGTDGSLPQWWIEDRSFPIVIVGLQSNVHVLAFSQELQKRHGHGAVIVRFAHGEGIVYHMISHVSSSKFFFCFFLFADSHFVVLDLFATQFVPSKTSS